LRFREAPEKLLGQVRGDRVFFQWDVLLGEEGELREVLQGESAWRSLGGAKVAGHGLSGLHLSRYLWPKGIVPFVIEEALAARRSVILDAIAEWNDRTHLSLVNFRKEESFLKRELGGSGQEAGAIWRLHFVAGEEGYSWSLLGLRRNTGGKGKAYHQPLSLAKGFPRSSVLHEIGHAIGLLHEQKRADRDSFIHVNLDAIQAGEVVQYEKATSSLGTVIGGYDYDSIMHYSPDAFSVRGQPTFKPLPGSPSRIGRNEHLSEGDVAAANTLYPREAPSPDPTTYRPVPGQKWKRQIGEAEAEKFVRLVLEHLPPSHPTALGRVRERTFRFLGAEIVLGVVTFGSAFSQETVSYRVLLRRREDEIELMSLTRERGP
jgi:hypothetical protein